MKLPKLRWKQYTRNCWSADVIREVDISIWRNSSWKRLGHTKPWSIKAFGNVWISRRTFAEADDAKAHAELIAARLVRKLAKRYKFAEHAIVVESGATLVYGASALPSASPEVATQMRDELERGRKARAE